MLSVSEGQIGYHLEKYRQDVTNVARLLYENPEYPGEEHYAKQLITGCLKNNGFNVDNVQGLDTAFVGRIGQQSGKSVGFLAEYDALPVVGHGCGHNLISASCLGAALVLKDLIDLKRFRVTVYGTPDEEFNGGKVFMIEKKVFDPNEAMLQIHFSNEETVICENSPSAASMELEFYGRSAHSAQQPHKGINALNAVLLTFHAVDCHRQQFSDDVRIPGTILNGGGAPNAIPEYSSARFHITSSNIDTTKDVIRKLKNCAEGAALATDCKLKVLDLPIYCSFRPNKKLSAWLYNSFKDFGEDASFGPIKASTDVGNVSLVSPCGMAFMNLTDSNIAMHSKEFANATVSEKGIDTMLKATKILVKTALLYFADKDSLL